MIELTNGPHKLANVWVDGMKLSVDELLRCSGPCGRVTHDPAELDEEGHCEECQHRVAADRRQAKLDSCYLVGRVL